MLAIGLKSLSPVHEPGRNMHRHVGSYPGTACQTRPRREILFGQAGMLALARLIHPAFEYLHSATPADTDAATVCGKHQTSGPAGFKQCHVGRHRNPPAHGLEYNLTSIDRLDRPIHRMISQ